MGREGIDDAEKCVGEADVGAGEGLLTLATSYGIHGSNGEPGCIRFCSGSSIHSDGADQRIRWSKERLVAIDHDERTLVYEIVDSNIGFNSYRSTMKVSPMVADGHDGSLIEWHLSDGWALQDLIAKYDTGLQRMAAKMDHHIHTNESVIKTATRCFSWSHQ